MKMKFSNINVLLHQFKGVSSDDEALAKIKEIEQNLGGLYKDIKVTKTSIIDYDDSNKYPVLEVSLSSTNNNCTEYDFELAIVELFTSTKYDQSMSNVLQFINDQLELYENLEEMTRTK